MNKEMRFEFVDFARGYAILGIVLYHAAQRLDLTGWQRQAIELGGTGVHLFFLLSGLGLAMSWKGQAAAFYRRRLTRVWFPYALALTLSWAAAAFLHFFPDGWEEWLAGVALYQMFSSAWMESFGGHFWFVSAIVQFYIVFPLLMRLLERMGAARFVALCAAVSVVWWLAVWAMGKESARAWNSFFLQFLWEFGIGMALGLRLRARFAPLPRALTLPAAAYLPIAALAIGLTAVLAKFGGSQGRIFNDVPALAGYAALCFVVYAFSKRFFPPLRDAVLWVSGIGYSLYLVHILSLEALTRWSGLPVSGLLIAVYLPAALLAGVVFDRLSARLTHFFEKGYKA